MARGTNADRYGRRAITDMHRFPLPTGPRATGLIPKDSGKVAELANIVSIATMEPVSDGGPGLPNHFIRKTVSRPFLFRRIYPPDTGVSSFYFYWSGSRGIRNRSASYPLQPIVHLAIGVFEVLVSWNLRLPTGCRWRERASLVGIACLQWKQKFRPMQTFGRLFADPATRNGGQLRGGRSPLARSMADFACQRSPPDRTWDLSSQRRQSDGKLTMMGSRRSTKGWLRIHRG